MMSLFGYGRSQPPRAPPAGTLDQDDDTDSVSHSVHSSKLSSNVTDSKNSAAKCSAFTAPPRYRNSGAFVHGTKFKNFHSIMRDGLRAAKSEIFMIDEVRSDGRVPGLKAPPEILIFIDEVKARSESMEFEYDAAHGTWKTKGINGVIRPWFFQKVVDQRKGPGRGNVLFQSKEDPVMVANTMKEGHVPRFLMHATYWENVTGIMKDGIVPAKNPTSSLRQPLKELLQGAESHVYTISMPGNMAAAGVDLPVVPQRPKQPEAVPEMAGDEDSFWRISPDEVGLERSPDAYFIIDTKKAAELGVPLSLVQSTEREDTVYVKGPVPREILVRVEPNEPVNLPESLKANIVDPRSFDDVPIIDLSQPDEAKLVEQMRYACEVVGFMQVVGHGIPVELQAKHFEFQQRFFALPPEVKERIRLSDDCPVRGYFGHGGEDLDSVLQEQVDGSNGQKIATQKRQDNKEALDCNGVPWAKPKGGWVSEIFGMASQLPEEEELEGFKEVLEEYSEAMFKLGQRVLSVMAQVLGLEKNYFEQHLTDPVATHRLLHYWPIQDFEKQIGVGEHTDYGLLTILKQDNVGGLQVLNYKDKKWVHAVPLENAYVINLGDMMGRWTGHRFKSTVHRVVNTSANERYSIPYFLEPNMDTVIKYGELSSKGGILEDEPRTKTAEAILESFYRASGQLKVRGFKDSPTSDKN